jgi:hypothetical protein
MSDLNLGPAPESNRTPAILISIGVLAAIAAAIYFFSPHTPSAIKVDKVDLFAPHTETKAAQGTLHLLGTPAFTEDNLYAVVHLSVENKLRLPLFLDTPEATLTTPEGVVAATVVSPADATRLEQSFPALTPLATNPIGSESQVEPRATLQGSVILLFPTLTESAWKTKKSATLTLNFHHYGPQMIDLP